MARVRRADLPPLKVVQLKDGVGQIVQTPVPLDEGMKFSKLLIPRGFARIDCTTIRKGEIVILCTHVMHTSDSL